MQNFQIWPPSGVVALLLLWSLQEVLLKWVRVMMRATLASSRCSVANFDHFSLESPYPIYFWYEVISKYFTSARYPRRRTRVKLLRRPLYVRVRPCSFFDGHSGRYSYSSMTRRRSVEPKAYNDSRVKPTSSAGLRKFPQNNKTVFSSDFTRWNKAIHTYHRMITTFYALFGT